MDTMKLKRSSNAPRVRVRGFGFFGPGDEGEFPKEVALDFLRGNDWTEVRSAPSKVRPVSDAPVKKSEVTTPAVKHQPDKEIEVK